MPGAKTGLRRVPLLSVRSLRLALLERRVTVRVYVWVLLFWAVTRMGIGLAPTLRLTGVAALVPFTVTVAVLSATVGVTVRLLTMVATEAV